MTDSDQTQQAGTPAEIPADQSKALKVTTQYHIYHLGAVDASGQRTMHKECEERVTTLELWAPGKATVSGTKILNGPLVVGRAMYIKPVNKMEHGLLTSPIVRIENE